MFKVHAYHSHRSGRWVAVVRDSEDAASGSAFTESDAILNAWDGLVAKMARRTIQL